MNADPTPQLPPVLPGFSEPIEGPLKVTSDMIGGSEDIASIIHGDSEWTAFWHGTSHGEYYSLRLGSPIALANGIGVEESKSYPPPESEWPDKPALSEGNYWVRMPMTCDDAGAGTFMFLDRDFGWLPCGSSWEDCVVFRSEPLPAAPVCNSCGGSGSVSVHPEFSGVPCEDCEEAKPEAADVKEYEKLLSEWFSPETLDDVLHHAKGFTDKSTLANVIIWGRQKEKELSQANAALGALRDALTTISKLKSDGEPLCPIAFAVKVASEALSDAPPAPDGWKTIETAPKGGGADSVTDPNWVDPPKILLLFQSDEQAVCYWDWYYSEGGNGHVDGRSAWVEGCSGDQVFLHYGEPIGWQPLPKPPTGKGITNG